MSLVGNTDCVQNCTKFHLILQLTVHIGAGMDWSYFLSYRKFVKAKCSHSTAVFHILALRMGKSDLHRRHKCVWDGMASAYSVGTCHRYRGFLQPLVIG